MKTLLITALLFTVPHFLQAQDIPEPESPIHTQPHGHNIISSEAFKAIQYNGYTIKQINNVNGEVDQLWGTPTSVGNSASWSTNYIYGANRVSYNDQFEYTQGITVLDDRWSVKVLGKEIRVGDSFSEMKQKFGDDLKIVYMPAISKRYAVTFDCTDNEYDGLVIYFDPTSHKVEEIKYFVNT